MALAPSGELATLGIARESTYGVAASPTVFLVPSDISFEGTNAPLLRDGARRRVGRTYPATGAFTGKGSFSAEADPDTIGALLNFALGTETVTTNATSGNPPTNTISTTLSAAAGPGTVSVACSSAASLAAGIQLVVGTGSTQETVTTLSGTTTTNIVAYFRYAHLSGETVTNATVFTAYDHVFTLGSPRGFFTAQINRVLDAINCTGNKVSTFALTADPKSILEAKITTEYAFEAYVPSPTTPAYSTLYPFVFENPGNLGKLNGSQSTATVLGWSFTLNTGLITDFNGFGLGRQRGQIPETQTKVTGTAKIAFETRDAYLAFWGNPTATGPQSLISPAAFEFDYVSTDSVNSKVAYALKVAGNASWIGANKIDIKPNGYIEQDVTFDCFETFNGLGDDLKVTLTNAASTTSI